MPGRLPMTHVYTIGYEGTDIDRFIATLKHVGVERLVDVRAVPLSRKKGFSKNKLRERVEAEGLSYVHLSALGDPKDGRDAARAGRFDQFRAIYTAHLLEPVAQVALRDLASLASAKASCLMCFEREPAECHRSLVVAALPKHFEVLHLFGDEPNRYVRNSAKLPSRRPYQSASAA
jgi:uncharacterized protein (DUF488 family)